MIKKISAIVMILLLSMVILFLLFQIHAIQVETNEISSRTSIGSELISTGEGNLKVMVKGPIPEEKEIYYVLCDTQWNPIDTNKINKKGIVLFKNIPEGTYKLKRIQGDIEKKMILSAYVTDSLTTTVLDCIQT